MDVVGQDDCAVKQVSKGHLAVDSPAGTDGQGGHAVAQEQIWHQQQQEQERPCLNKNRATLRWSVQLRLSKAFLSREALSLPIALSMIWCCNSWGVEESTPSTV